jgi:hypothetical protein
MPPSEITLEPVNTNVGESLRDSQLRLGETQLRDQDRQLHLVRQLRDRHWTMLCLALFIIVASCVLRLRGAQAVRLPWTDVGLPMMCGSRVLFGIECPGCGLTRSFIALAAGDIWESLRFHRVGWLLALAVVAQIPYRLIALRELRTRIVQRAWPVWFGYFLIAVLVMNWLFKMAAG